jgi:hypothetical protein
MNLAEATYQPRIAESGQWVQREETLDDDVVTGLNDRGHATFEVPALGAMQSIRKHRRGQSHNWSWAAAADTRRDGDTDGVGDAMRRVAATEAPNVTVCAAAAAQFGDADRPPVGGQISSLAWDAYPDSRLNDSGTPDDAPVKTKEHQFEPISE